MKLSEQLKLDHESGDFGNALDGYSEKAAHLENRIAELEANQIPSGFIPIQKSLVKFLNGDGALDGLNFGDVNPLKPKAKYWWRYALPEVKS